MSSWGNDAPPLRWAAAGLLLTGCMLGGDGDDDLSPYESAVIDVPVEYGVADGLTGVNVVITGDVGARLVLEVIGEGTFLNPDPGKPREKTVFLADSDGTGQATAPVIAIQPGTVAVAFKPDPLRGPRQIRFLPVVFAAGPPSAVKLHPGLVETEICFAVNSTQGLLVTRALIDPEAPPDGGDTGDSGSEEPLTEEDTDALPAPAPGVQATALISDAPPDGLTCPTDADALDEIGWVGWTKMFVRTDLEHAVLSLDYRKESAGTSLYNRQLELFLDPFPGYDVAVENLVDQVDYLQVDLHIDYLALGDLGGGPAEGVELTQRFIPEEGPALLGSSAGGPEDPLITDAGGDLTLFLDNTTTGTFVWYVTLSGGIQKRLDDLTIPAAAL